MIFTTDPAYASYGLEPDPGQQAEDAQLYRQVLHELIHIGTGLARALQAQAIAHAHAAMQDPTPPKPSTDQATAFDRIARAIRRTITLARSLSELPAPARTPAHPGAARRPTPPEAGQGAARYPDALPGHGDAEAPAETPSADLRDRPETPDRDAPDRDRDGPDRDEDDTGRPPAEVIAEIRRDLGLDAPPGTQPSTHGTRADRTPADVEQPCAQAAAPITAAPSSPRHPAPRSQDPTDDAAQRPSSPAEPRAGQPAPVHPRCTLPDDPAEAIAMLPRHPGRTEGRWRPPPTR